MQTLEEEKTRHNPQGYLIGTELFESQVKAGRYIAGNRYVYGRYERTIDLILSVNSVEGSKIPNRLVTASRDYPDQSMQVNPSARPPIVLTTYYLTCPNPTVKQPRNRVLHIGGHENPKFLSEGEEYESLFSKLKTEDFVNQSAGAL